MPRSFLVKKKRQADMVNREADRVDTGTTPSRRIYSEGTPADKSHDNTDVSTEIKSRDTTNHQINPNMENGFKLDSSVGLETSFSVVFSQSHGKLYDGTEQAFRFLSAPQRDTCELNKGKLATWSFGAHSKREPLALPVVIKHEVVGDDEDGSAFMMEENGWEEKFTKKSSFESLDIPPSLFGHSSIAAGNQHHLALKTENEDFEISEFLQLDEVEIMEQSEEISQDYARCSSPSSLASEDSFPGSIGNSADFSSSFGNSEDANRASTSQRKDAKAKNVSNKKYRYTCDVCGKSFSRSNTLTTHKRIHTGDKPFICEQCGRAFRQPGNLTRHRLTHTTVKPYVCPQCNKAFNRASNLHTHMRTHTNYKPFVCDFCGKGFHQKIDMKIHRYTHTGEKPHKCDKCGRGFKQLTHLTYHLRTHSEMRMYQCEHCGKGFNQKGNLQAHIYGHTGERPFKCQTCGKGFTLASTLNTHKRTHASKKPFECQFCSKAFYQKNALKTHYIASHPYANGVSLL